MTGMDDAESDQDADSEVEDYSSDRNEGWSDAGSSTNSYAKTSKTSSPDSPPPGEKGSLQNPILLKTNNPENPVDD